MQLDVSDGREQKDDRYDISFSPLPLKKPFSGVTVDVIGEEGSSVIEDVFRRLEL